MSVTPPPLQRSLSALKSSGHSIRERLFQFKETDPSFADCFGDEAYTTETMYGKITLWRITGGLSYTAAKIQETLIKLIAEKSTDWQSRRPRNDASPFHQPPYLIQCFFVGVSKAHAAPYVTIITSVEWFSICLKDIILKGKILSAYPDWGCFRLPVDPHLTSNVTHRALEIPCCIDEGDYEVYTPGDTVPTHISATEVEIWKGESFIAKATAGGMITVGNEDLALTVAHAFCPHQNPRPTSFDIDVSELNLLLQQNREHTSNMMDFSGVSQCRAYLSPVSTPSSPTGLDLPPRPPASKKYKTLIGHLRYISTVGGDDLGMPSSLDWALIRITHPNISTMNPPRPTPSHVTSDHSVMIHTISKSIDCHLISEALFGIAGCTRPKPVKVANTGGVQHGDSGAWVSQLGTEDPIGILIGSCSPLNESYILGIGDILQDIEAQTGLKASVTPNQDIISKKGSKELIHAT
ncbi:hypothetical protein FALBO_3653 [Fusarium albosuccineum]|uniref:Uncharacterized protein n=1 Tax=Fusarium albosuccineum TaxID=1237068 RepID=A0A8H4LIM4_9HYPO|nr:hypothetical protein FALBO_3653 [Fusarium albosuccineum]